LVLFASSGRYGHCMILQSRVKVRGASALEGLFIEAVDELLRLYRRPGRAHRDPGYVDDVLSQGNARANPVADETLCDVCPVWTVWTVHHVIGMTDHPRR